MKYMWIRSSCFYNLSLFITSTDSDVCKNFLHKLRKRQKCIWQYKIKFPFGRHVVDLKASHETRNVQRHQKQVARFQNKSSAHPAGVMKHWKMESLQLKAWKCFRRSTQTCLTNRVEKNPFFSKKKLSCFFVVFCEKVFFVFFKRNKILLFFYGKWKNPILNCFHCIMQYHYFQNYTIFNLLYLLCHSNFTAKKCTPSVFSQIFVQFTLKWWSSARMRTTNKQRKTISTQTLQFHVKFICMPC